MFRSDTGRLYPTAYATLEWLVRQLISTFVENVIFLGNKFAINDWLPPRAWLYYHGQVR